MDRRAIIISAPLRKGQKGYLAGAEADVTRWTNYLTSLAGGEWYPEEIKVLVNQSKRVVKEYIDDCEGDYAFVAFSGHGYMDSESGMTYCKLREGEFLDEHDLYPLDIPKIVISIDACREITRPSRIIETFEKGIRVPVSARKITTTRDIYDDCIDANLEGTTLLFGANPNQEAGENWKGGFFTQSIIEAADRFSFKQSGSDVIDVYDALNQSKVIIKKYTKVQTPTIKVGRRNTYFPFGVRLYESQSVYG